MFNYDIYLGYLLTPVHTMVKYVFICQLLVVTLHLLVSEIGHIAHIPVLLAKTNRTK